MSQDLIALKLKKYIELTRPELIAHLKKEFPDDSDKKIAELYQYQKKLIKGFKEGCCFGYAIIHGAMDIVGKLDWWEETLIAIANWDEKLTSLEKLIELPDAEENTLETTEKDLENLKSNKKATALKTLFVRVLNYIRLSQVGTFNGFWGNELFLENQNQGNTLSSPHYFEILDSSGTVKHPENFISTGGYLEEGQLYELLNEDNVTNSICLIHGKRHSFRVGVRENKWLLYDSNYNHTRKEDIHKLFDTKLELVKELIKKQGNSLGIEIATLDPLKKISFPKINAFYRENLLAHLNDQGLEKMVSNNKSELLSELLLEVEKAKAFTLLAESLSRHIPKTHNSLYTIASLAPQFFSKTVELALKAINGEDHVRQALVSVENDTCCLNKIYCNLPDMLPDLMEYLFTAKNASELILQATGAIFKDGWTLLAAMSESHPQLVKKIITLTIQTQEGVISLAKVLAKQNNIGQSTFQAVVHFLPDIFPDILSHMNKVDNAYVPMIDAIVKNCDKNWTGLYTIACKSPDQLGDVLIYASQQSSGILAIAKALRIKNSVTNLTCLELIEQHHPNVLPLAISICRQAILLELKTQNEKQMTGFQVMACDNPNELIDKLNFLEKDDKTCSIIEEILKQKDQRNNSGLKILFNKLPDHVFTIVNKYAPSLLNDLLLLEFFRAVKLQDLDKVKKYIIEKQINPNQMYKFNKTPLHFAVDQQNYDLTQLLLENGADTNYLDKSLSIFKTAVYRGNLKILKLLHKTTLNFYGQGSFVLGCAAANLYDDLKCERFKKAARTLEIIKYLVDLKIDPNVIVFSEDMSPLMYAASHGSHPMGIELGRLLLENGANPNFTDRRGRAPIHYASHPNFIKLLLEKGADPNLKCDIIPLNVAAYHCQIESIELFLKHKADPNFTNKSGKNSLILAIEGIQKNSLKSNTVPIENYLKAIALLLEYGADPKQINNQGQTPLSLAKEIGNEELMQMLKLAKKKQTEGPIIRLPQEMLSLIFSFLDAHTLLKIASVTKLWNTLSSNDSLWKRHVRPTNWFFRGVQTTNLFFNENNIKKFVMAEMNGTKKKNIYYLCLRSEEKNPIKKIHKIDHRSNAHLYTDFNTCWTVARCSMFPSQSPDEKNIVYKLFISDEQLNKMNLEIQWTPGLPTVAYTTHSYESFELEVLEVIYQPVMGGDFQKVKIESSQPVKELEAPQDKQKTNCIVS